MGKDVSRVSAVIGLARHAHDTAGAAALLLEDGHTNSAVPLVRLTYEDALTAVWLVQSHDHHGITAFMHEYARGRRALRADASLAASAVFREGADQVTDADPSPYEDKLDSFQQFRQLCLDLNPGGVDAYLLYRVLSGYSHASVNVADLYLEEAEGGVPGKRDEPKEALSPALLYYLLACSLVWVGRAFTYLSHDRAHRSLLRRSARRLGVNSEPQLSESYHKRHAAK